MKIKYHSPSVDGYISTLTQSGVPAEYAGAFAGFALAAKDGDFSPKHSDLEKLIGRKPTSVAVFLKQVYGASQK